MDCACLTQCFWRKARVSLSHFWSTSSSAGPRMPHSPSSQLSFIWSLGRPTSFNASQLHTCAPCSPQARASPTRLMAPANEVHIRLLAASCAPNQPFNMASTTNSWFQVELLPLQNWPVQHPNCSLFDWPGLPVFSPIKAYFDVGFL